MDSGLPRIQFRDSFFKLKQAMLFKKQNPELDIKSAIFTKSLRIVSSENYEVSIRIQRLPDPTQNIHLT